MGELERVPSVLNKLVLLTTYGTCHTSPLLLVRTLAVLPVSVGASCVTGDFVVSKMVSVPRVVMPFPLPSKETVMKASLENLRQGRHMVSTLTTAGHQKR